MTMKRFFGEKRSFINTWNGVVETMIKNRLRTIAALPAGLLIFLSGAGTIYAHVTVLPKETTQGVYEKFTVRVPTEKDIPTIKVEVKFPAAVSISRFEPMPGWKYDISKDASGAITGVVWTALGEGLAATEFGEFDMQGKVADNAKDLSWKAYQTYKDGSVVEWTGAPDSEKPASVTKVKPKAAGSPADSHGNTAADTSPTAAAKEGVEYTRLPLVLSSAALIVSILSLGLAWWRRVH